MIESLLTILSHWIISVISTLGYGGVVLLMAIESMCIPLPSEVIMPFSGYLVSTGQFNIWLTALAGAVGCLVGSLIAYGIGAWLGRPLLESWITKYGKYAFIHLKDLEKAHTWMAKYGEWGIFTARLLPVIRTFISLPAGIVGMNLWKFSVYTLVGSYIWSWALAWIGWKLGEHWDTLGKYFHGLDFIVVGAIIVFAIWWIGRYRKQRG